MNTIFYSSVFVTYDVVKQQITERPCHHRT